MPSEGLRIQLLTPHTTAVNAQMSPMIAFGDRSTGLSIVFVQRQGVARAFGGAVAG